MFGRFSPSVSTLVMVMTVRAVPMLSAGARLSFSVVFSCDAPEAVATPGTLLALFAAVFGPPAPPTFCELAGKFFPLAALPVCALSDAASAVILPAQIPHHYPGPVLHVSLLRRRRVLRVPRGGFCGELFNQWEYVVRLLIILFDELVVPLLVKLFLCRKRVRGRIIVRIQHFQLAVDLQSWYKM